MVKRKSVSLLFYHTSYICMCMPTLFSLKMKAQCYLLYTIFSCIYMYTFWFPPSYSRLNGEQSTVSIPIITYFQFLYHTQ
jgi:hypothetical protein